VLALDGRRGCRLVAHVAHVVSAPVDAGCLSRVGSPAAGEKPPNQRVTTSSRMTLNP
jgi:hypothetical protein